MVNPKEEDFSARYQAIHELDALAARIEQALPANLADELYDRTSRHVAEVADGKAMKKWLDEKVVTLLPSTGQDMGDKYTIISIDTPVGTYELSSRLEKMHLFEDWLLKNHKVSFKRLRVIYLRYKTSADRIFQV